MSTQPLHKEFQSPLFLQDTVLQSTYIYTAQKEQELMLPLFQWASPILCLQHLLPPRAYLCGRRTCESYEQGLIRILEERGKKKKKLCTNQEIILQNKHYSFFWSSAHPFQYFYFCVCVVMCISTVIGVYEGEVQKHSLFRLCTSKQLLYSRHTSVQNLY